MIALYAHLLTALYAHLSCIRYCFTGWQYHPVFCRWCLFVECEQVTGLRQRLLRFSCALQSAHVPELEPDVIPDYLGITRRSCLEAHMVLDMEYREQEWLEHGPGGPIFLLLRQLCPVSSTSFHHHRPGFASERTLAPWGNWSQVSWYVSYLIIITFLYMH